jgi:hypothetical protein
MYTPPSPAAQWVRVVDAFAFRPTACFIPAQGNTLGSSHVLPLQANGLPHKVGPVGSNDLIQLRELLNKYHVEFDERYVWD